MNDPLSEDQAERLIEHLNTLDTRQIAFLVIAYDDANVQILGLTDIPITAVAMALMITATDILEKMNERAEKAKEN